MNTFIAILLLHLQIIITRIHLVIGTKCVVSKWKGWSDCEGSCEFAQRFRNRDVVRPPLPEKDRRTGELVLRNCPHLYEVQRCLPKHCADESPFARGLPLPNVKRSSNRFSSEASQDENLQQTHNTNGTKDDETQQQQPLKRQKLAGIGILHTALSNRLECDYLNAGCCKIVRITCSHGATPSSSQIRWYRKKDDQFCRPYRYPVCTAAGQTETGTAFTSEEECLNACFSEVEKAVLPAFRII